MLANLGHRLSSTSRKYEIYNAATNEFLGYATSDGDLRDTISLGSVEDIVMNDGQGFFRPIGQDEYAFLVKSITNNDVYSRLVEMNRNTNPGEITRLCKLSTIYAKRGRHELRCVVKEDGVIISRFMTFNDVKKTRQKQRW